MTALSIQCKIYPFQVPHFTLTNGAIMYGFPTKADFLIADIDGDGVITDADAALWSDALSVDMRLMELVDLAHPDHNPNDDFPFIWDDTWWQTESVRIWCIFDGIEVTLSWMKDTWQLALVLPSAMIELQTSLVLLGSNQPRFVRFAKENNDIINRFTDELKNHTMEWFMTTPTYQELARRIDHVNRTYVRL